MRCLDLMLSIIVLFTKHFLINLDALFYRYVHLKKSTFLKKGMLIYKYIKGIINVMT